MSDTDQAPAPETDSTSELTAEKPIEAAPVEATPDAPVESEKPVIPDVYEFKLEDGRELNKDLIEAMVPSFKELELTQEKAGKLVSTFDAFAKAAEEKADRDFQNFMQEQSKQNIATIKKEWGNDYSANLAVAQKGVARFLSNDAKKVLDQTGLGNHPEFIKAFYQIGQMIQEDTPPAHIAGNKKPGTFADALYGNPQ